MKYNTMLKRKKLYERLSVAMTYPLSLVVAPMGYGKTTVVENYFEHHGIDPLWLYFEIEETSPKYIWDTFSRQLKSTNEALGDLFEAVGFPITTPQRNQVITTIASYAKKKPLHIVIDDYQFNLSTEIDDFIQLLIRANISGLNLIILSRTTPGLNVTEFQLKNRCYRITEKEFMLSLQDVAKIFRLQKVHVENEIIERTYQISEGWISAVLLLVQRYKETSNIDSVEDIEELIATTIMRDYVDESKEIAVLGILDSFSMEQLSTILGKRTAEGLIHKLLKKGAFIHYNKKSKRYAIHNIFSKYLYDYEFLQLGEEHQRIYYKASGQWYVDNAYVMEGIRCFLLAEEYEMILQEFEKKSIAKVYDYYPHYVNEILNSIPKTLLYNYPLAYLSYLHFLITAHNVRYGAQLLFELEGELNQYNCQQYTPPLKLEGELEFLKGMIAYNDVSRMFGHQRAAFDIISGPSLATRPDKMPCAGSYSILYMYYKALGFLKDTAESIHKNMHYYDKLSGRIGTGIDYLVLAEYYLEIGDIDQSELLCKKGVLKAKQLPQFDAIICGTYLLARCLLAKGQPREALELMNAMTEDKSYQLTALFQSIRSPYFFAMDSIYLMTGQIENVSSSLKEKALDNKMLFFQSKGLGYILFGRYLLIEKKYLELEVFCDEMVRQFEPFHYLLGYLNAHIMKSIAYYHLYGIKMAKLIFNEALKIGSSDGIITSFTEYGCELMPVLKAYQETETMGREAHEVAYFSMLLSKTKDYAAMQHCCSQEEEAVTLTNRERDIMALLCTGKRNAEIASALFVSESAVKKMLTSIYRKYGVKNRTAAIKMYEGQFIK